MNQASVADVSAHDLRDRLRGEVIAREDPGYDEARRVWNAMIDKRPALIVRPRGAEDVVAAVDLARGRGLPVAVRCGGHSVAGKGACEDGLLIDLSLMKGVQVDQARRTARANGGVLWGEFDRETQVSGLATPGGRVTGTGLGGFTLGGGYG
jgi:FAD/FMN-containing dehydrogenase